MTQIKRWRARRAIIDHLTTSPEGQMLRLKKLGFSDARLGELTGSYTNHEVRTLYKLRFLA